MSLQILYSNLGALLLMITTPVLVQYLATIGQDKEFSFADVLENLSGNYVSWSLIFITSVWAIVWLKIPSRKTFGPVTYYNERPEYQDNGFTYYIASVVAFIICQWLWPQLSSTVFWNMPFIIGSLNISTFIFCIYICYVGLTSPEYPTNNKSSSTMYLFYSGVELHPQIFGMQIKQLTNCRIGLMYWQTLVLAFFIVSLERNGFNSGSFVNCFLQTMYLAKFYCSEDGYFSTIDMMYDSAGYYLCWGCLVFVPSFFTYAAYYLVLHPPVISDSFSIFLLALGLISIVMTYRVDYEKLEFQKNRFNDNFKLWGQKVKYITVTYVNGEGEKRESRLLVSGCWGVARHLNYLFELLTTLSWSLPGLGLGLHTFLYFLFLFGLMVHRCFRDEERCYEKYGDGYKQYCKRVPYRILPFVF